MHESSHCNDFAEVTLHPITMRGCILPRHSKGGSALLDLDGALWLKEVRVLPQVNNCRRAEAELIEH